MDKLEFSAFAKNYCIQFADNGFDIHQVLPFGDAIDVSNDLAVASTAKGSQFMAVLRKGAKDSESGKLKQWLEIWNKVTKIKSIDVSAVEEHGDILADSQFGSFVWSPDGTRLLYVAEYKYPKAQSYYKTKKSTENKDKPKDYDVRGREFAFLDDWGEAFDGVHHTVVGVLNINDFSIKTFEMYGKSLGQPFWIENGDRIGFVGWEENPRRLGIVYCTNRLSGVYVCDLNSTVDAVPQLICGGHNSSVRSPRTNADRNGFVYLEEVSGGPHRKASRLMFYDILTKTNSIIIDNNVSRELISDNNERKYGKPSALFTDGLPLNCFTSDGKYIILNNFSDVRSLICLVNIETNDLKVLNFPVESSTVIDVRDDIIVSVGSSPNIKPNIYIAKFSESSIDNMKWTKIETNLDKFIPDVTFNSYSIASDDPNKLLNPILISPKSVADTIAPTVILPHGGPHSVALSTYMTHPILFAKLGLKTLLVNYRGSMGVDEDYVNTLCGNVGSMDVSDVVACVHYLSDKNLIDSSKLILFGGSHGGFLITQLSGQHSNMGFKACIARNPVIDIAGMFEMTDIPDWNCTEGLGLQSPYSFTTVGGPDSFGTMFKKSPINWIDNVKVPTLMLLGKKDRRVPMSQGLKYYYGLKARGIKTKCYVYEDKHDLAKVDVDGDAFINICLWIFEHLNE